MVLLIGGANNAGDSGAFLTGGDFPSALFVYYSGDDLTHNCKALLKDDDVYFGVYFVTSIILFAIFIARTIMMGNNTHGTRRYSMDTRQGKFEISLVILTALYFLTWIWEISAFAVLHIGCKDFMKAFRIGYDSEKYLKKADELAYASLRMVTPKTVVIWFLFFLARIAFARSFKVFRLGGVSLIIYVQYFLVLVSFVLGGVASSAIYEGLTFGDWYFTKSTKQLQRLFDANYGFTWTFLALNLIVALLFIPLIIKSSSRVSDLGYSTRSSIILYILVGIEALAAVGLVVAQDRYLHLSWEEVLNGTKRARMLTHVLRWLPLIETFFAMVLAYVPGWVVYRDSWFADFKMHGKPGVRYGA